MYRKIISFINNVFQFDRWREFFYNRRQWHGLPCYVEEEEVSEVGARGGRAGEGGLEGSRETHAGIEESGEGTCPFFVLLISARYKIINGTLQET